MKKLFAFTLVALSACCAFAEEAPAAPAGPSKFDLEGKLALASKGDAVKAREELAAQYEAEVADGVNVAVEGLVDDVIDPADSRKMVIAALEILSSKRDSNPPKKHDNLPM